MKMISISLCMPFSYPIYSIQTGKLGGFRQDLGGAKAVEPKGKRGKSDPGADLRAARGSILLKFTGFGQVGNVVFFQLLYQPWYRCVCVTL